MKHDQVPAHTTERPAPLISTKIQSSFDFQHHLNTGIILSSSGVYERRAVALPSHNNISETVLHEFYIPAKALRVSHPVTSSKYNLQALQGILSQ